MHPPSCPYLVSSTGVALHPERLNTSPHRPSSHQEFTRIAQTYSALASTGCTAKFCQSGRSKHTDEERVGRNQPLEEVEKDAVDFLYQLYRGGIIDSEQALNDRIKEVLEEIKSKATVARYTALGGVGAESTQHPTVGLVGGNWTQSPDELQFGIRAAWKHARKCIMRSEYKDLKLCDLRHVNTSAGMATELISALQAAFNGGEIRPTVFMFPPRGPNERGPVIWNGQLLSFAGYTTEDGSILGDPMNAELTKAIIELGWTPPPVRSKWDLLPLVTMAQGDEPVITELPKDAFPLVPIQHPQHKLAFHKLGLRWIPAPALSRLGFTIGGVQYTASPFIGWFMDAEIGVRNLVDPFRYNVLPQVIKQLGLFSGDLDEIPDFERLALISRAQVELNYAVSWSFAHAKMRMIDSLGASEMFSRFDDEHLAEHGYRLPSDPYWIAPPQGSLIPLWHRGAAPNYQPKPMICHHVQDPIKAWRREQGRRDRLATRDVSVKLTVPLNATMNARKIFVGFCSSGTVAAKLCNKLQRLLVDAAAANPDFGAVMPVQTLNAVRRARLHSDDTLILVASNTRRGEMPTNGTDFLEALENNNLTIASRFAIFGNGSLDYVDTFNQNAKVLEKLLRKGGATSLLDSVHADTAAENPPWSAFNLFCKELNLALTGTPPTPELGAEELEFMEHPTQMALEHTKKTWFQAKITDIIPGPSDKSMKCVVLDIDSNSYSPMSYISILPPNPECVVQSLLRDLNIKKDEGSLLFDGVAVEELFRFYADLQQPFKSGEWADAIVRCGTLRDEELKGLPILQVVAHLPPNWRDWASTDDLCRAVPRIQPRKYSVASDCGHAVNPGSNSRRLELLVQHHDGGRFSDICLNSIQLNAPLACRIERAPHLERMASAVDRALILFCTGSGMAPVRALLQHRVHLLTGTASVSTTCLPHAPISLLAGFKSDDEDFVQETVAEARSLGLFDMVSLTPSNPEKRRPQDAVFEGGVGLRLVEKIKDGALVFVCAKAEAEKDFLENLSALLGADAIDVLGGRYMADVYQPAV